MKGFSSHLVQVILVTSSASALNYQLQRFSKTQSSFVKSVTFPMKRDHLRDLNKPKYSCHWHFKNNVGSSAFA